MLKKLNRNEPQKTTIVICGWNTRFYTELMKGKHFPFTSNSQMYDRRIKRFKPKKEREAA